MDAAKEKMPDSGKWSVLLGLKRQDDDTWKGKAKKENGRYRKNITYSDDAGLQFDK